MMTFRKRYRPWVSFLTFRTLMGRLQIHNTEERVNDAATLIDEVLSLGELSKKGALTLRGKLVFCDPFVFGRLGRMSLLFFLLHVLFDLKVQSLLNKKHDPSPIMAGWSCVAARDYKACLYESVCLFL